MRRKNGKPESASDPLDQVDFILDEQQSEEFANLLADPPAPTQKLKDLMNRKSPWENWLQEPIPGLAPVFTGLAKTPIRSSFTPFLTAQ